MNAELPDVLWQLIFSFIAVDSYSAIVLTCKEWDRLAKNPIIWGKMFKFNIHRNMSNIPVQLPATVTELIINVSRYSLTSGSEIIAENVTLIIRKFIDKQPFKASSDYVEHIVLLGLDRIEKLIIRPFDHAWRDCTIFVDLPKLHTLWNQTKIINCKISDRCKKQLTNVERCIHGRNRAGFDDVHTIRNVYLYDTLHLNPDKLKEVYFTRFNVMGTIDCADLIKPENIEKLHFKEGHFIRNLHLLVNCMEFVLRRDLFDPYELQSLPHNANRIITILS